MDNQNLQLQLDRLKKDIEALSLEFHNNNFSASQDFNKYSRFNTRLKVPHYATLPSTCEVGEIAEQGGELNICSSANTWTVCGTQT
jgi:hypothetical protein